MFHVGHTRVPVLEHFGAKEEHLVDPLLHHPLQVVFFGRPCGSSCLTSQVEHGGHCVAGVQTSHVDTVYDPHRIATNPKRMHKYAKYEGVTCPLPKELLRKKVLAAQHSMLVIGRPVSIQGSHLKKALQKVLQTEPDYITVYICGPKQL